jgi:FtsP/CotA-like multicopper oxidase with cupredoxin domain
VKGLSRRELVGAAGAVAAASPAVKAAARQGARGAAPGGVLLKCRFKETVLDGTRVRLRAYNDTVPGPLISVNPGQVLNIRVKNELPPYDSSAWNGDHNVPHDLGTTNLHMHGMEIIPHLFEPVGTSDPLAPMIAIKPGEHKDYAFEIAADMPPGLYWYHPHHHGSTVVQAVTGMAGPLIVYGAIDQVPEIKAARDILLAIQDIGLFPSDDEPGLWTYEPKQNAIWQTFGGNVTIYDPATGKAEPTALKGGFTTGDYALRYFLLNGKPFFKETHNPDPSKATESVPTQLPVQRFTLQPGEVVRFRMLNANSDNLMPIVVEGHEVHLLALDAVNFPQVRPIPVYKGTKGLGQMLLAPANRAEFLIKAVSKPGVYRILQLAQSEQFLTSAQKTICEIEVKGPPRDMPLPTSLPVPDRYYPLIQASEVKRRRIVQFMGDFPGTLNPYVGIDFLINNMQYGESAVPNVINLNEAEEWDLVVEGAHHGGTEGHPFHIHEVSFEVISTRHGNDPPVIMPPGVIMDTVWVPMNTTTTIRFKATQWPGKTVFHCHILPHEDTGMMQNILFVDPKAGRHH